MKAVVVEIKDGNAAVLSDEGCVISIKNNNFEVGQIIQINKPKIEWSRKLAGFVASAATFLILGVGSWAYASPYTYISLDVNPSIEYMANRFDRVITINAVNDDGEEILKETSIKKLKNKSIQDAITKTIDEISESGYFDHDGKGGIMIATSGKNSEKADELAAQLQELAENEAIENGDNIQVESISVSQDRVEKAKELGITPGKLNLIEKLQEASSDPASVEIEDWLDKSVKDILKATKESKTSEPASDSFHQIKENANSTVPEKNKEKDSEETESKPKIEKAAEKESKANEKENQKADKDIQNIGNDKEKSSLKEKKQTEKSNSQEAKIKEKSVLDQQEPANTIQTDSSKDDSSKDDSSKDNSTTKKISDIQKQSSDQNKDNNQKGTEKTDQHEINNQTETEKSSDKKASAEAEAESVTQKPDQEVPIPNTEKQGDASAESDHRNSTQDSSTNNQDNNNSGNNSGNASKDVDAGNSNTSSDHNEATNTVSNSNNTGDNNSSHSEGKVHTASDQ